MTETTTYAPSLADCVADYPAFGGGNVARPSLGDGGSINTTIRLTARRRAELEAEAKQRGITLSALIREKLETDEHQTRRRQK